MLGGRQSVDDESSGVIAIGVNTINDNNSIAIGQGAYALNNQSIAIGTSQENPTTAGGINSIAIGNEVDAAGDNSIAIGSHFDSSFEGYIAGVDTLATADNSIAIGQAAMARAHSAIAVGSGVYYVGGGLYEQTIANSEGSIALGRRAIAGDENEPFYTQGAIAIGLGAKANTDGSSRPVEGIAIGGGANAKNGIAIGNCASASTNSVYHSIAIGPSTKANYKNSVAIGFDVTVDQDYQFKLGNSANTVYIPGNLIVDGNINGVGVSDKRLKNIGEEYQAGLEELKKLTFFHYTFKNDENKIPRVGVMAQDLQKVFPNAVVKGENGYLRIRLEDMFYAVINAVKELDKKIASIAEDVIGMKKIISEQQKTINAQQKTISEQQKTINAQQTVIEELQKQNYEFEKRLRKLEKHDR